MPSLLSVYHTTAAGVYVECLYQVPGLQSSRWLVAWVASRTIVRAHLPFCRISSKHYVSVAKARGILSPSTARPMADKQYGIVSYVHQYSTGTRYNIRNGEYE